MKISRGYWFVYLLTAIVLGVVSILDTAEIMTDDYTAWLFGIMLPLGIMTTFGPTSLFGRIGFAGRVLYTSIMLFLLSSVWKDEPNVHVWPLVAAGMLAAMIACILAGSFLDRRDRERAALPH